MYVDEYFDHHVEVKYITAHTNHQLDSVELPYLPLPKSAREEVALKVSKGIPPELENTRWYVLIIMLVYSTIHHDIQMLERMLVTVQSDKSLTKLCLGSISCQIKMFVMSGGLY